MCCNADSNETATSKLAGPRYSATCLRPSHRVAYAALDLIEVAHFCFKEDCRKTYRSQQCDRSGQRQNRFPRKLEVCRECQIPIEPVRHHLIPREGREAGI